MAAPLGPDSLAWRLGFDRRALLLAGRSLLMQVMHPVIGAGVHDHSVFRTDPWGRLERTVGSLVTQLFGGPDAVAEGQRLRETHRSIRGTGFHGERYSALHPEPYAWVHLSIFSSMLELYGLFEQPLTGAQQRQFYAEWRQAGLVLGVAQRRMPPTLGEFHTYLDGMIDTRLAPNPAAQDLLESLTLNDVPPPPWRLFPKALWAPLRPLGRFALYDTTVGTLPPALREKLGLEWTDVHERRLRRFAAAVRATAPLVPERLRQYPLAYRARRAARGVPA
ncbi:oxygenase MpaB family protein [Kutzneria viridogrisea]|uniref:ER-bound oxygenase mpaB/mpaB'/Rubber oxygenase catalytic domain-containing protein n=2 Tax=Kutzneria TaxID=43356 RepID=W5W5Y3_9PSEU|nr:oxygenase MpaB family protein [Kutzneria albida]AHH95906.1 hypothetical protein KALB_2538 [Kutzneria albida DSM 43870]MBA8928894.1 uncharacterized protein (DUF2236 family) [Kutzneria viridogrisea]